MNERAKVIEFVAGIVREHLRSACETKQIDVEELARLTGLTLAETQHCLQNPTAASSRVLFRISCYLNIEADIIEIFRPLL